MACLDENAVAELFDGILSADARGRVVGHLDTCASCRRLVAAVGAEHSGSASAATLPGTLEHARVERGTTIGRYVIVRAVGAGSMGVVYLAYDPELDRRVAIKRLTAHDEAASANRKRVLAEAKSMARLSHPNVVAIHDVLEAHGAAHIAMEFVDGETITRWRQANRSETEILEVFRQAGKGLAAAHAVGVVHRDFKPDNVLVSGDGRARVTDFGLARLTAGEGLAPKGERARELVGTPRYMAPEVLAGEPACAASDQFSFCFALHESLLGEPVQVGRAKDVPEPRTPARAGRGRVPFRIRRAIVRGLARAPADRHPSMNDLLDELRPRRPLGTIGIAAAAAVAIVGGWAVTQQTAEPDPCPTVDLDDVYSPARRAAIAAALSPWEDGAAWTAKIDAGLRDYSSQWERMHADACRATHLRRTQTETVLGTRMACLENRRRDMLALVDVLAELSPEAGPSAIESVRRLPSIASCADADALARQDEQNVTPVPIREALSRLRAMIDAGDYARATPAAESLAQQAAAAPGRARAEVALAVAWLHINRAQYEPTQAALQRAIVAADGAAADDIRAEALVLSTFVEGYALAHPDRAAQLGEQADSLQQRVGAGPIARARLWRYRGLTRQRQGRFEDAAAAHRRSVALLAAANLTRHPEYPKALIELGNAHRTLRALDLAEQEYRDALQIQTETLGEQHPHIANTFHGLGDVLSIRRDYDGALALYEQALQIHQRSFGPEHLYIAGDRLAKAQVYIELDRQQDAETELTAAIEYYQRHAPDDAHHAVALSELAELRRAQGRQAEALKAQLANVALRRRITPRHPDFAVALRNTAIIYLNQSQPEQALRYAEEAAALAKKVLPPTHPFVGVCEESRAFTLLGVGRLTEAKDAAEAALTIWAEHPRDVQPRDRFLARWTLARVLWRLGRQRERAIRLASLAMTEYETSEDANEAELEAVRRWLAAPS